MFAELIDAAFSAWTDRKMRQHLPYPADRTAVVLVDVQRGFFAEDAAGYAAIRAVAELVGFREHLVDLTTGCRRRGAVVVHAPFEVPPEAEETPDVPYVDRLREQGILVGEAEGTNLPPELLEREDLVLEGRTTLNAFYGTRLEERLEERGITHLLVAGSVANAGVDSTGRMGVELDYDVTYVADCIAAFEPSEYEASVEVTFPRMANRVLGTGEALAAFGAL